MEILLVHVHKCSKENVSIYQPITWDQVVSFCRAEGGGWFDHAYIGSGRKGSRK